MDSRNTSLMTRVSRTSQMAMFILVTMMIQIVLRTWRVNTSALVGQG